MSTASPPTRSPANRTGCRRPALVALGLPALAAFWCGVSAYRTFLNCTPELPRDMQLGCLFAPRPTAPVVRLPGASPLTKDSYLYENPAWSPDGRTIAVIRNTVNQNPHGPNPSNWEVVLLDVATKEMRVMNLGAGAQITEGTWPTWSPDSRYLAFTAIVERIPPTPPQVLPTDVHRFIFHSVADSSSRQLDCQYCGWPRWLADGSLLVVAGTDATLDKLAVSKIDPETGAVLSDSPIANVVDLYVSVNDAELLVFDFVASPEGRQVTASLYDGGRCTGIWRYAAETQALVPFVDSSESDECDPAWAPDGTKLAYTVKDANVAAPSRLVIANADSSAARAWLQPGLAFYQIRYPAWSPDGTRMVFAYGIFELTRPSYSTLYVADVPAELRPASAATATP